MVKLGTLLYEIARDKRAILFAGPAASGKTTIIKHYIPPKFQEYIINADKYYEPELEKIGGGGMQQGKFSHDQLSKAGSAMNRAQKQAKADYREALLRGRPIIMDITGGSKNETTRKKHELENAGYEVAMVMVYASPMTTLKRNSIRNRNLKPSIVLRNWKDVISNIKSYKQTFGEDHFILVNNDDEKESETFSAQKAEEYFKINPNYIELTPEEKEVLEREINSRIEETNDIGFTAFDELDSKLKTFLNVK